jgi:hypothetical protein
MLSEVHDLRSKLRQAMEQQQRADQEHQSQDAARRIEHGNALAELQANIRQNEQQAQNAAAAAEVGAPAAGSLTLMMILEHACV